MQETIFYQKLSSQKVRCEVCSRNCLISEGQKGFCQTRFNKNGKLYSEIYGKISYGLQIDPIEKKPMYHFFPGTNVLSFGSVGCNFRCKQCLNYDTTYLFDPKNSDSQLEIKATEIIAKAKDHHLPGIAFTYNEPTINLEFIHDVAILARKNKLYTVLVTNGYLTEKSLDYLGPYIDAYSVDFKGFSDRSYLAQGNNIKAQIIFDLTKRALKKWGMKIEITTLLIPGINDDEKELEKMARWITENLGHNTPWHLSQYSPELAPDSKFRKIGKTPVFLLQKVYDIGRKAGLNFVFAWAPQDHFAINDSVCPSCQNLLIQRNSWQPEIINLDPEGNCVKCHYHPDIRLA